MKIKAFGEQFIIYPGTSDTVEDSKTGKFYIISCSINGEIEIKNRPGKIMNMNEVSSYPSGKTCTACNGKGVV